MRRKVWMTPTPTRETMKALGLAKTPKPPKPRLCVLGGVKLPEPAHRLGEEEEVTTERVSDFR